jgi:hypothetical protein
MEELLTKFIEIGRGPRDAAGDLILIVTEFNALLAKGGTLLLNATKCAVAAMMLPHETRQLRRRMRVSAWLVQLAFNYRHCWPGTSGWGPTS